VFAAKAFQTWRVEAKISTIWRLCGFGKSSENEKVLNKPRNPQASTQSEFLRTFRMIYQPFLQ